jgi:hypothetical protein
MAISDYDHKALVLFSTIICSAARQRDWGSELGNNAAAPNVQEVQCMRLVDGLYVAGNGNEHVAIANLFKAFNVGGHDSFILCLRYCRTLLTLDQSQRKKKLGKGYNRFERSPAEIESLDYAAAADPWVTLLSEQEMADAKALLERTNDTGMTPQQKMLAWILRKVAAPDKPAAWLARPNAAAYVSVTKYNGAHPVTLVDETSDVHAELKLLAFLTRACTANALPAGNHKVEVGGLKRACSHCDAWMGYFRNWIRLQYRVDVVAPVADTRAQGGGAGSRPSDVGRDGFGRYVGELFNGGVNNTFANLAAYSNDDAW